MNVIPSNLRPRALAVTLALLFMGGGAVGAQNAENLVPVDSPVYRWLNLLYTQAGLALPNRTGPYTVEQLQSFLTTVEQATDKPSESFVRNLHAIEDALKPKAIFTEKASEGPGVALGIRQAVNPELYSNLGDTSIPWLYDYNDRPPLYKVNFDAWVLDNLYLGFDMEVKKNPVVDAVQTQPVTNLFDDVGMEDFQWPYWAGLVTGGDHWDFRFFRSAMDFGAGSTNLVLSPDAGVVDNIMFSTWWSGLTYTFLWIPMDDYAINTAALAAGSYGIAGPDQEQGSKNLIMHRVTVHFLPTWTVSATELMIYEGIFDVRYLAPVFIDHNWFVQTDSNVDACLDFEGGLLPGWIIYGQWYLDYIRTWFKSAVGDDNPAAYGYLLGTRVSFPVGDDLDGTLQIEAVYSDPFLYINENLNMMYTWRYQTNWNGSSIQGSRIFMTPFGFGLGPDVIWVDPLLRVEKVEEWKAELSFPLTIHGENSIYSPAPQLLGSPYYKDPNTYLYLTTPTGTPQITQEVCLAGELDGKMLPFPLGWNTSIGLQIAFLAIWNKDNVAAGADFAVQSALTWKNSF